VVIAVRSGTLSPTEAHDRYQLSAEEFAQWEEAFDRDGIAGRQVKALSGRNPPKEKNCPSPGRRRGGSP